MFISKICDDVDINDNLQFLNKRIKNIFALVRIIIKCIFELLKKIKYYLLGNKINAHNVLPFAFMWISLHKTQNLHISSTETKHVLGASIFVYFF